MRVQTKQVEDSPTTLRPPDFVEAAAEVVAEATALDVADATSETVEDMIGAGRMSDDCSQESEVFKRLVRGEI